MRWRNADEFTRELRLSKRLLGVRYKGKYLHPAFQFLPGGEVHPAMARVLHAMPVTDANWNAAFWFFSRTGLLGAQRPADVFRDDPDSVVVAAQQAFGNHNFEG